MSSSPPPPPRSSPSLLPEIGPDGIARESPIIAYTEKVIEAEKLQLRRYIQENYSKIREVERELENLNLELKLTSGPKKAALEHLRKKIELSNEKILLSRIKEEEARKTWEASAQVVKDYEAEKQKLCDDLNQLIQESSNTQFTRLEELRRRLEFLSHGRIPSNVSQESKGTQETNNKIVVVQDTQIQPANSISRVPQNSTTPSNINNASELQIDTHKQPPVEVKEKKMTVNTGRGKGNTILPNGKGRPSGQGWTGAGFDVGTGT